MNIESHAHYLNKFEIDLAKAVPAPGYNLLRKYGLIQEAPIDDVHNRSALQEAIRQFTQITDSFEDEPKDVEFYVDVPKLGGGMGGGQVPPPAGNRELFRDKVGTVLFRTPIRKLCGYGDIPPPNEHASLIRSMSGWFDSLEFEMAMIVAAGMRGIRKVSYGAWRTSHSPQLAADKLPPAVAYLSEKHEVTAPTLNVAEWQTIEQMKSSDEIDYTKARRARSFIGALDNLYEYIEPRYSEKPVHYGIKPAKVRLPIKGSNDQETEEAERYVLFISNERANALQASKEWRGLQGDLYDRFGSDSNIVGTHRNIVVIANLCTPIFERDGHKFSRALLFGKQAMVIASRKSNEGMPGDLLTPYKCNFHPIRYDSVGVDIAFNFGLKKVTYHSRDDGIPIQDSGIAAFDMYEGEAD